MLEAARAKKRQSYPSSPKSPPAPLDQRGEKNEARAYGAKELAAALGITDRAVRKRADEELWPYREEGSKGGRKKLYLYAALPRDVQKAIEVWEMKELVASQVPEGQGSGVRGQGLGKEEGQLPATVGQARVLAAWQNRKAQYEADLLRLYLEAAGRAPWGQVLAAKLAFLAAYNEGRSYPQLFAALGPLTYKTVERWAVKVKKAKQQSTDVIQVLAPRHGDHLRGVRRLWGRAGKLEDLMRTLQGQILLAWALSPNRYNKAEAIFKARESMRRRGLPADEPDAAYKRFLDEFEARKNHIWVYSREGKQAWNDKCAFYIERDYNLLEVGDCLVADGHTLNFDTINPYTGKPKRLTIITFMDMKSNFPVGWEIMPSENTQAIAAALRRGILGLGKAPLCVYLDNGRAFGAKYFTGDLAQAGLSGLFERLGIATIFAWPYHGQSKTVERWHKTLKAFEKDAPTYVGGGIDEKPPRLHRGEREHRRMWEKLTRGAVPSLMQTHRALARWLDVEYNPRPQPRGHLQGKSPLEVFMAGRGAGVDPAELHYLMLSQTVRTIHRRGITHNGKDYYAEELYGRRHPVLIRYDLLDPDAILVFEEDGSYLCEARVMTQVHPIARITGTPAHREELVRQIEVKKHQEKEASSFCRMITETLVQPETEAHFERLGLRADGRAPVIPEENLLTLPSAAEFEAQVAAAERRQAAAEAEEAEGFWRRLRELPEQERYERLEDLKMQGRELPQEEMAFQRYFEQTETYQTFREYFEERRLLFSLGLTAEAQ